MSEMDIHNGLAHKFHNHSGGKMITQFCKLLVVGVLLFSFAPRAMSQGKKDLAQIRKTTSAKLVEPNYENEPRYTLVVIGPDAEKRVWMVLDGFKTVYADLNGDGKLNSKSEKFSASEVSEYPKGRRNLSKNTFHLGEVHGQTLSYQVFVPSHDYQDRNPIVQKNTDLHLKNGWIRSWLSRTKEPVKNEGMTGVVFTPKAADAQVSWLDGPVRIIANDRDLRPRKKLGVPRPSDNYTVTIGSVGIPVRETKGTVITPLLKSELPKDVHPLARFQFESGIVEVELDQVRSRGVLAGTVLMPEGESPAEVDVEISYPKSARSNIQSATQTIAIK